MNYKKLLFSLFFIALVLTSSLCKKENGTNLYNIIIITVDTLRADHLGIYDYQYNTSPCIDSFAQKSTVFEYAYCPIPKTAASFASFMTGLHPFVHKTKPNLGILKEKYITLAEALKMKGYTNIAVVDNPNLSTKFKFNQGFDQYVEVWNLIEEKSESTNFITNKVASLLNEKRDTPFFLWAHYIEPHCPYIPPEEFIEERPDGRDIKKIEKKIIAGSPNERTILREKNSNEGFFISLYDGAVKYVDSEIGKLIDLIHEKGYIKNSIVVISSDHGEELGEHNFFWQHGPLAFNSSARVPLIIYSPDKKSKRIKYPVSLMDIYPTVLDILDLSLPYEIQGANLFKKPNKRLLKIKGTDGTGISGSFSVIFNNHHHVRVSKKLSKKLDLETKFLYDIYQDPYEINTLYSEKKELSQYMENEYIQFFDKHRKKEKEEKVELSPEEIEKLKALGYIK